MSREWDRLSEDTKGTIRAHQADLPIKLSSLARDLDVELLSATLGVGISGEIRPSESDPEKFVIRVNRHDASRRQRFTVAHEIAHYLLHRDQIGTGLKDDVLYRSKLSDWREAEANRLAADILMPNQLVKEWLENAKLLQVDDIVGYLADRFDVSEASMRIKLGL
jgi:Zn-dependent peptidase ImmA (M78 family)